MDNLIKDQKTVTMDEVTAIATITMDTVIIMDTQDVGVSTARLVE